jgi:hypothetical protein
MYGTKSKSRHDAIRPAVRRLWLFAWMSAAAAFALLGTSVHGLDASLSGSYKTYTNWLYDPLWQEDSYGLATGILRLKASFYPADWASLELAYTLNPEIQPGFLQGSSVFPGSGTGEYRVIDLRRRLLPWSSAQVNNIRLYNDLDRAAITLNLPFADVSAGRQAVAWGSARIVNPTDVIVPMRFSAMESEYRLGVDALRIRIPFGSMHEGDIGYIFGEDFRFDRSAAFARVKLHLFQTDISALAMLFREDLMVGADLSRAIGNAGAWLETAYVIPDLLNLGTAGEAWAQDYLRLSAGLDYNFSGGLYTYLEAHYNSPGAIDAADYAQLLNEPAYTDGGVYLLGRYYLGLGATYPAGALLPVSALVLVNLTDPSAVISLSVEYNIKENVYWEWGCALGLGRNPVLAGSELAEYRSEFGVYPNTVYTAVKMYF